MGEAEREKVERELLDAMDVVRLKSDEYCTFFNDDCEGCFLDDSVTGCCLAVKLEGAVRQKLGYGATSEAAQ